MDWGWLSWHLGRCMPLGMQVPIHRRYCEQPHHSLNRMVCCEDVQGWILHQDILSHCIVVVRGLPWYHDCLGTEWRLRMRNSHLRFLVCGRQFRWLSVWYWMNQSCSLAVGRMSRWWMMIVLRSVCYWAESSILGVVQVWVWHQNRLF